MQGLKDISDLQQDIKPAKKTKRPPLYNVFLVVSGKLKAGDRDKSIEMTGQCEEALRTVFKKTEPEADQHICETLTTGQSLVGVFKWEIADDKVTLGNAMLNKNTLPPPVDKPLEFKLRKA